MIKKILGTAGTRVLHAGLTFVIMIMLTNNIGADGFGIYTLLVLSMSLIMLFVDLVAGSGLIYFTSRRNIVSLLATSYVWLILTLLFFIGIGYLLNFTPNFKAFFIPEGFEIQILIFTFLNGINYINFNILMGKEKIKEFNISFTIHIISVVVFLSFFLFVIKEKTAYAYLGAVYSAYGISFLVSLYYMLPMVDFQKPIHILSDIKHIIAFGFYGQGANAIQLTNKRLNHIIIGKLLGVGSLGIYSSGVQLTEGLRLIGISISMVQFSRISNTDDKEYACRLSIQLLKFTVITTALALFCIIIIPEHTFTWILGNDFVGVKPIILSLSIGVLSLAASMIFSHYFSGIGKPHYNMWATGIGATFTIFLSFMLIPKYGFVGAGITTSLAYTTALIYQVIIFTKITQTKLTAFIPQKQDFDFLKHEIRQLINQRRK